MARQNNKIAIVEDDSAQSELLQSWLQEANIEFEAFDSGEAILDRMPAQDFSMILLDWELPDTTGIEIVSEIRERLKDVLPILFTTNRDSEQDIVKALHAGADDYLIKPLRKAELFARINAIYRRSQDHKQLHNNTENLVFLPYTLSTVTSMVNFNNKSVQLTAKEFELALFLFQHHGEVLSRGHILETVWGQRADLNTRTVDTHVSLLRQKLELRPHNGWRLSTIYRHGYRLEEMPV